MDPLQAPADRPLAVDWNDWRQSLQRFAAATGLAVSAFDTDGTRSIGPLHGSPIAGQIDAAGLWADGGSALAFERALVARVIASGRTEQAAVGEELQLQASPLELGGAVRGVIVYGWVFHTFTTSLACQRIGRELGLDGAGLWAEARLESPVPAARMGVYADLLQTMVASADRHAQALGRLEELGRMREVFLAGVSHELRTPLSALSLRIEVMLRVGFDDPAASRAALLKMKQHVATEARLVEDLIDAARTRTGQLSIQRGRVAIGAVLQAAIAAVVPHAEARQVQLAAPAIDTLGETVVDGDAHRLQQVFWNLLSNAVKFTPADGRVEVRAVNDGHMLEIIFADSGQGMDRALLPHVFDAFTKQQQDNVQGLGLGLSIARHIVELHGGTIWAESPGVRLGAMFHVLLPKTQAS